jgi:hypothetical protein
VGGPLRDYTLCLVDISVAPFGIDCDGKGA